ncbi:MAG TPA: DUF2199 domain-containing protein [Terriglobales bacterium]|nr:DUF2199 domain-containing protein [Terriglobales bacterium]
MSNKIQCATHGECQETFVCTHLVGESSGLGFNRDDPDDDHPFPDAWCDDCEIIRSAHGGWNDESSKLAKISLLCSGCYERARIRNLRTSITLDDLADVRWKCSDCEEWHTGPCLDFGYDSPYYWSEEHEEKQRRSSLLPAWSRRNPKTFLDEDFCAIDGEDFFVRGVIHLPIVGAAETFRWGVWGSLSRENFETLQRMEDDPKRVELPPMFSWLSTRLPEYPDTLSLKMYAQIREPGLRPTFRLELTDHPLSQEYHNGIAPERVKKIMLAGLRDCE